MASSNENQFTRIAKEATKNRFVFLAGCVLYELQPFRLCDLVAFCQSFFRISYELFEVFLDVLETLPGTIHSGINTIKSIHLKYWAVLMLWVAGFVAFWRFEFATVYILFSLIGAIFMNLGTRKEGEFSAYSVFNDGFKQLMGTLNAEQFEQELLGAAPGAAHGRHGGRGAAADNVVQLEDVLRAQEGEDAARPAVAGRRNRRR